MTNIWVWWGSYGGANPILSRLAQDHAEEPRSRWGFFFPTEKLNSDEMIIKLLGATGSRRQMEAPLTQESLD